MKVNCKLDLGAWAQTGIVGPGPLRQARHHGECSPRASTEGHASWDQASANDVCKVARVSGVVPNWVHAVPLAMAAAAHADRRASEQGWRIAVTESITVSVHVDHISLFRDEIAAAALELTDSMDFRPLRKVKHAQRSCQSD